MKIDILKNEYRHNNKFRGYVDDYAKSNHITVEEALGHELVRQVYLSYTEV